MEEILRNEIVVEFDDGRAIGHGSLLKEREVSHRDDVPVGWMGWIQPGGHLSSESEQVCRDHRATRLKPLTQHPHGRCWGKGRYRQAVPPWGGSGGLTARRGSARFDTESAAQGLQAGRVVDGRQVGHQRLKAIDGVTERVHAVESKAAVGGASDSDLVSDLGE